MSLKIKLTSLPQAGDAEFPVLDEPRSRGQGDHLPQCVNGRGQVAEFLLQVHQFRRTGQYGLIIECVPDSPLQMREGNIPYVNIWILRPLQK